MTTTDKKLLIEIIEKINLQSKSVYKDLGTTKVLFLLSTVPPHMFPWRKYGIYNRKLGFEGCWTSAKHGLSEHPVNGGLFDLVVVRISKLL
jgi:hypothetical protein